MNNSIISLGLLALFLFTAGCTRTPVKPAEDSCTMDSDCSCGTHIETGSCFYGNKAYVNVEKQCPDYCSGIAGNLEIKCVDNKCVQEKASQSQCSTDAECAQEGSRCADGVDPYHVCREGKCIQLTFAADPCRMSHTCPKGKWQQQTETYCFRWENCAETGCDDNSDETIDECVNIGTRSEGCKYTIIKADKSSCTQDSDCVPAECCHPRSCVNKEFSPVCDDIMCTMSCEGPIDCGAGTCGCVDGKCEIKPLRYN